MSTTTTLPIAAIKISLVEELKSSRCNTVSDAVTGAIIVSCFKTVAFCDYRLAISDLPDGLWRIYNEARQNMHHIYDGIKIEERINLADD